MASSKCQKVLRFAKFNNAAVLIYWGEEDHIVQRRLDPLSSSLWYFVLIKDVLWRIKFILLKQLSRKLS